MAKTINSDLIRGNINTIILKALYDGDRYGYDIIKEIEIKSHGQYILKQPTLYSCLKRLENQGFIESYWGEQISNGGRRKYYRLTDSGKAIFKQSQDEYEYSRTVIDNLISDNQYDLSSLDSKAEKSDNDNDKNLLEGQQLAMDVSALELNEDLTEKSETETEIENANDNKNTVNEYIEPAPIFSENTENFDTNSELEQVENSATTLQQEPQLENETLKISNSDYINSLLSQNHGSYFSRDLQDNTNEISKICATNYAQNTDEVDEINQRLEAFKASYNKEIEQSEENLANNYAQPSIEYKPKPLFQTRSINLEENVDSYNNGFYKYNVSHDGINTKQDDVIERKPLSSLINTDTTAKSTQDIPQPKPVSIKEQIKIHNFGKLSESIEELGENVKLRPHYDSKHDYKKQYYYRDSYLRLYHFGIMFLLMLIEVFATYVVGKQLLGADTSYDITFYILSIIGCFVLPVFASATYIFSPNSKKRNDYNLKSSIIFRLIVTIQLLLIIYALNVWMGMPITFDGKYFITLALPLVFVINLPISALIFNSLRKKEKFALKE